LGTIVMTFTGAQTSASNHGIMSVCCRRSEVVHRASALLDLYAPQHTRRKERVVVPGARCTDPLAPAMGEARPKDQQ
jgi:hypothetical protein